MAQVVVMPQLGNTVESCLITSWLVAVGDVVDASSLLCEIETDKSAMEVPSGASGTVLALLAAEGDEVPVKQPIVVVGEPGENIEQVLAEAGLPPATTGEAGEVDESASATSATADEPLVPQAPEPGQQVPERSRVQAQVQVRASRRGLSAPRAPGQVPPV